MGANGMSTEIAVREAPPAVVRLSTDQLQYIARTEFVPKSMRGNLPAILACVATGRSLGLSDMAALRSINIIDGKASFSAELMVSLVRERGHSITGNFSGESCTVTGRRADNGDEMTVTWTMEMAREAGLLGKDNWKKYKPSMLWARAVSQLCRMLFADCFSGAGGTYTSEELGSDDTYDEAEDAAFEPQPEAVGDGGAVAGVATGEAQDANPAVDGDVGAAPSASAAQIKKLNVLVGQLRTGGHITNRQLWLGCEREPVPSEDGELHWSPLRDSLSKAEAIGLIDRLEKFQASLVEEGLVA